MRMPLIALLFSVTSLTSAIASSPIFPEDGSTPMGKWYHGISRPKTTLEKTVAAYRSEGVETVQLFDYEWVQDLATFTEDGTLLLQAPLPDDSSIAVGLTMGVLDDEPGGFFRYIDGAYADKKAISHQQMKWSFFEGGGVISGKYSNGESYLIIRKLELKRTQLYYEYSTGSKIDDGEALNLMALDTGVKAKNITVVPYSGHIDLIMMPLPGGKLLFSDNTKAASVLKRIMADPKTPQSEMPKLREMYTIHTTGFVGGYNSSNPKKPFSKYQLEQIEKVYQVLKERFEVITVAGQFMDAKEYGNSTDKYLAANINFFNGTMGKSPRGNLFVVTNQGELSALENYWSSVLKKYGNISKQHVHYVGRYAFGAGADCMGASAGRLLQDNQSSSGE